MSTGFEVMDNMIAATRQEMKEFPGTPEEFLGVSMIQYQRAADLAPHGAGAKHMALSMFLLARQQELIERLVDDLRMRDDVVSMLFEISDL